MGEKLLDASCMLSAHLITISFLDFSFHFWLEGNTRNKGGMNIEEGWWEECGINAHRNDTQHINQKPKN